MEPVAEARVADALRPLRIVVVKHAHTPSGGAEDDLCLYLEPRVALLGLLAHPFREARGIPPHTQWRVWERGAEPLEHLGWRGHGPGMLFHLRDVVETCRRLLWSRQRWDVLVGVDCMNATLGILLRALGRVRTVIFYTIDYVPERFPNRWLNAFYHGLDRFAARHADCVWNLSPRVAGARAQVALPPERAAPQIVVPMGAPLPTRPLCPAPEPTVVFVGHLAPEQGLDLLFEAWPRVQDIHPGARIRIVGSGGYRAELERLAEAHGIEAAITWLGFVADDELHDALTPGWVAIAPYPDTGETYKQYAGPGKLRWYAAAGLPLVVTPVPQAALDLEAAGAALIVEATPAAIAEAIGGLFADPERRSAMAEAARRFAQDYTWAAIFDAAWAATWPYLEARWSRR